MNFALILFLLTLVTGVVWLSTSRVRAGARARALPCDSTASVPATPRGAARRRRERAARAVVGRVREGFFPVLLVVFLLRSFLAEPFKIPSSSMRPTLEVGDFILVNKFIYGIRLPIIEQKIVPLSRPAARRRRGVPLSAESVAGLHQARRRRRRRRRRVPGQAAHGQRQAAAADSPTGTYSYLEGLRFETLERSARETDGAGGGARAHDRHQSAGAAGLSAQRAAVFRAARIATTMSAASPAGCRRATTS